VKYQVRITDVTFLNKSMVLLRMEGDDDRPLSGTCQIPWVVKMFHWLSDSGALLPKKNADAAERWDHIPAIVDVTPGMIVECMKLLLDRESPGRDLLTAWLVMEG